LAQISLPRVNRITTSMLWESAIFRKTERWASLKFYLFFKYFNKFFFLYPYIFYKVSWMPSPRQRIFTYQLRYRLLLKTSFFWKNKLLVLSKVLKEAESSLQPLQSYLYTLNNQYYVFFIFFNWERVKRNSTRFARYQRKLKKIKKNITC